MALIKTLKEMQNADLEQRVIHLRDRFNRSIRTIFGEKDDGVPFHIGTCSLYFDGTTKYLITAAHVLDWNAETKLVIGKGDRSFYLRGDSFRTKAPLNNRKNDHYDFAWMPLSDEMESQFPLEDFLTKADLALPGTESKGKRFGAIGYPNSKSTDIDRQMKVVESESKIYTSSVQENKGLTDFLKVSGNDHLFLKFNSKWSFDENGYRAHSFKPTGMSGGLLIDMGPLHTSLIPELPKQEDLKVAGLLIENFKEFNSIVAVRFELIIHAIENTPE